MIRRYALVRQDDQSDCGAAALATIARHHGISMGVQRLRDLAGTDQVGTNLQGIVHAAEAIGFSARAVKGTYDALSGVPLPAIAHVRNEDGHGHFVVLYRADKKRVVIGDPARGVDKRSRDEFTERWTGYLVILTPSSAPQSVAVGDKPTRSWRRLVQLLSSHLPTLGEALLCAVLITMLGLSTSYFIQHLVDSVLVRQETGLLNALGVGMLGILVFRTLFGILRQYLLAHISRKIDLGLMSSYANHLVGLPLKFFETRRVGEIISRMNDAAKIREAISGMTITAVVDGVLVIAMVAVLFTYDVQLALATTVFIPLLIACVIAHQPSAKRLSRQAMEEAAQYSAHLVEDISGVETIKAFDCQRMRREQGEDRLVRVVQSAFSLQMLGMSMSSFGALVTGAAGILVLWYGGHRVMHGALTIGQLMFFYTLLAYLLGPLERLASLNLQLQDALVAVDRLYQVMDLPLESDGESKVTLRGIKQAIELDRVDFRYGSRENVLNEVSLTIPAGKKVAVVGESGSGKSTLLKLLMHFYTPCSGRVTVDGIDIRDIDRASLRKRIGVVAQEPYIFNGTIEENITMSEKVALDEVIAAAHAAGLDDFISSLPDRYDTMIGERGANLSGGQRQRLAIARALLRQPDLLIFDEATSHLDTATERAIQENLRTACANRTVVLVAHRLSTVRDADWIYVLHRGEVVEQGSHQDLIRLGGRYASLWQTQSDVSPAVTEVARCDEAHANHESAALAGAGPEHRGQDTNSLALQN